MTNIEKIQAIYESERAELLERYKSKAIDKRLYDKFLQQTNRAETMDIMDAMLEGEE
tara:strand:+ start:44 stop:214 length:171 start_codon:yes stop_codon:yes gene_type:complete